jgi:hypothetical protein
MCVCVYFVFVLSCVYQSPCDGLITSPRSPTIYEKLLRNWIRGQDPEWAGKAIEKKNQCRFMQYTCFLAEIPLLWLFLLDYLWIMCPNRQTQRKSMTLQHPLCIHLVMNACIRYCTCKHIHTYTHINRTVTRLVNIITHSTFKIFKVTVLIYKWRTIYIKESTCCNFGGFKQNNVCGNMEISLVSSPSQQNRPCHPIPN